MCWSLQLPCRLCFLGSVGLGLRENMQKLAVICRVPWKRLPVLAFAPSARVLGVGFLTGLISTLLFEAEGTTAHSAF